MTLLQPNASSWTQSYGYDAGNRLQTVSSWAGAFTYTFKGPGNLVTNLALPNGATITNAFDSVARLTGTWLKNSGGTNLNSHIYGYNLANQRTAVTNFFTNYVNYTYDLIGELKTAVGKESGGSLRLNEQFGYAYDAAGNLNYRTNNALIQTFGVNNLNELTNATRSGTLTVAGGTTSTATNVMVNGSTASRYNDNTFALAGFTVTNGNNAYTAIAQDSYNRKDTNSVVFNLPSTVNYIYDLNGNLTSDSKRGFDYDDENQLIRVTVTNSWKSEFTYDGRMRRRITKEFTWNGTWTQTNEVRYIYDGNVVLQWRDANNIPTLTLTRGLDLSGSLQGAGGIGGLLARTDAATGQSAYFQADGNGNITCLINGGQIVVAKYLYDPFGNTLSKSGSLADANTYRFSSKDYHASSGLCYYGYRFYDSNLHRWLNRDPLEEAGGINLYQFGGNTPINSNDPDGRIWWIAIGVGAVAIIVAVVVLPDWDARAMNQAEKRKVNDLLSAIKSCAREANDEEMCKNLNSLVPTGRFKKPVDNEDSAETRKGRFFGLNGPRTILSSKVSQMDDCTLANVLIHESYHAGTRDFTETKSYDYADKKLQKIKQCLQKKGFASQCP